MILYYTGAIEYNFPQSEPDKSLGGFQSNSIIPNGRLNNLFPDDTYKDNKDGSIIHRAIILVNDGANTSDLVISNNNPVNSKFKIEMALVTLVQPADQIMEDIQNQSDLPYHGTFFEVNVDNPLNVGVLQANKKLGIWIRKTLSAGTSLSCEDLVTSDITTTIKKDFNILLIWQ